MALSLDSFTAEVGVAHDLGEGGVASLGVAPAAVNAAAGVA